MPVPSWRSPPGLLSFFGAKVGGQLPAFDMPNYSGVVDLSDWLLADSTQELFNSQALNAQIPVGSAVFPAGALVPAGKVWILTDLYFQTGVLGAGVTWQGQLCVQMGVGAFVALGPPGNVAGPGDLAVCTTFDRRPIVLRPGWQLELLTVKGVLGPTAGVWNQRVIQVDI